jgi:hypothetical protein
MVMPRNVQSDPEASLTWVLKDELIRRGGVYYAKLACGKDDVPRASDDSTFTPSGECAEEDEKRRLSRNARSICACFEESGKWAPADLRDESGVKDRQAFHRGLDELQAAMIVVPSEVYYQRNSRHLVARHRRFPTRSSNA